MRCQITGTIRTGKPCTQEATRVSCVGHHVCDDCYNESELIAQCINELHRQQGTFAGIIRLGAERN